MKPLYWARRDGHLLVGSEVKAFAHLGVDVHEVPPGHCGWAAPDADPELSPYIDLLSLGEGQPMITDVDEAKAAVRDTLRQATPGGWTPTCRSG